MLLVQEFLKTRSFGDLAKEHGVYASFSKSAHKWSMNYDQIEAKENDPLSQECRGLILARQDGQSYLSQAVEINGRLNYDHIIPGETKILAYPMKRFFNHGQGSAASVDWSDPKLAILEKLDGTLCIVYYDPFTTKWCVATRSVSEADLFMDNGLFTFRTLFEKALKETSNLDFEDIANLLEPNKTYCFELTTPYNRIVVNYPNNIITLLSIRDLNSLKEINLDFTEPYIDLFPVVQRHTFTSVDDLINLVSSLNPMEHEGVVVCDSQFNRVKVKNAAYVAYNRARDVLGTSERNCLELILQEKDDDVIPFLPEEIVNNLIKIKKNYQIMMKTYDDHYQAKLAEANAILPGDKKTFAILVTKEKEMWHAPFFNMFASKASNMKEFVQSNKKEGTWANGFLDRLLEVSKTVKS